MVDAVTGSTCYIFSCVNAAGKACDLNQKAPQ